MLLLSSADFFKKNSFRNTIRVSNGSDLDQDRHSVHLGPNCLQRLSADNLSQCLNGKIYIYIVGIRFCRTLFSSLRKRTYFINGVGRVKGEATNIPSQNLVYMYVLQTCVKRPLNNRQNKDLNDRW